VIDEEPPTDLGPGMDFDPGEKTAEMGGQTADKVKFALPEGVGQTMEEDGVEAGIAKNDLGDVSDCGVAFEHRLEVVLESLQHGKSSLYSHRGRQFF
jgi:hypothetical protein